MFIKIYFELYELDLDVRESSGGLKRGYGVKIEVDFTMLTIPLDFLTKVFMIEERFKRNL